MSSRVARLEKKGLIHPPKWLSSNIHFETIMGSMAYGVSSDASDMDVYGFCIPPKDMVFPHLAGEIHGFGRQIQRFDQYHQHHIKVPEERKEYDITIYSIVKYFQLCMENNPNMVDSLFTPRNMILHSTPIGELVRENRKMFLHKGSFQKFKGYAFSQMNKIRGKRNASNPNRAASIEEIGFDVKFAYHVVRLVLQCEQILMEGDLDLQRNREHLKAIRRGDYSLDEIDDFFKMKELALEKLYNESTLQHSPDEAKIKQLLIDCLEMHFGNLDNAVKRDVDTLQLVQEMQSVLNKYR